MVLAFFCTPHFLSQQPYVLRCPLPYSSAFYFWLSVSVSPVFIQLLCSGWWFCQCESKRGWAPATYLEPLDGPEEPEDIEPNYEGQLIYLFSLFKSFSVFRLFLSVTLCVPAGELYVTIKAYKAEQEDEISLEIGETIEVIHKLLDGWWVVR